MRHGGRNDRILDGYHGRVDAIGPVLSGWVTEVARPKSPVSFSLVVDGWYQLPVVADRLRPELAAVGVRAATCGFRIDLPSRFRDGAEHQLALVLPDGRGLNLPGSPRRLVLPTTEIIPVGAADLAALVELLRRTDSEGGFDPQHVSSENAAAFAAIRSPAQGFVFLAQSGTELVGYGRLDRGSGDAARLGVVALTVLRAFRRKGLGEALLRALLDAAAAEASLHQVWLSVRPDNTPAIRLYEKLGFVRDAKHPPGRWARPGQLTMVWPAPR